MINSKNIVIALLVGALVASGALWVFAPASVGEVVNNPLGALTGPDIPYEYFGVNGVKVYKSKMDMQTGTTTLCYIANPLGTAGTSTIVSFAAQINTGTSTAATISLATSTDRYATTTADELIADATVASGAKRTISWQPTSNLNIIGPGQYLLFRTSSAGLSGYAYGGTCQASFESTSN